MFMIICEPVDLIPLAQKMCCDAGRCMTNSTSFSEHPTNIARVGTQILTRKLGLR